MAKKKHHSQPSTMLTHIKELRNRSLFVLTALIIGGFVGYYFFSEIVVWLTHPLGTSLYYTSPAGSFNFVMKVVAVTGVALALPVFIFQLISFLQPALARPIRPITLLSLTITSCLLAGAGAAFGFYLVLPGALRFFSGFQVEGLSALITADSYLGFVTNVLLIFMAAFQLPLILSIVDHVSPLTPLKLFKAQRWVILGALVISLFAPFALDVTTSLLVSLPIILLYNVAVLVVIVRHRQLRHRRQTEAALAADLDDHFFAEYLRERQRASAQELPLHSRGFAMEFKRSQLESIEQLRQKIEIEKQRRIAEKVARYNKTAKEKVISEIKLS